MTITHSLGFPRIGAQRELKFALESYWNGDSSRDELKGIGAQLRKRHWSDQSGLDLVPVGDFSFYDQVLDMSFTLGNVPERVRGFHGDALDSYFRVARGRSARTAMACGMLRRRGSRRDDQVVRHQLPLHRAGIRRATRSSSSTPRACCEQLARGARRWASTPSR